MSKSDIHNTGTVFLRCCWLFLSICPQCEPDGRDALTPHLSARGERGLCLLQSSRVTFGAPTQSRHGVFSRSDLRKPHEEVEEGQEEEFASSFPRVSENSHSLPVTPAPTDRFTPTNLTTARKAQKQRPAKQTHTSVWHMPPVAPLARAVGEAAAKYWPFVLLVAATVTIACPVLFYRFYVDWHNERHFFEETKKEDGPHVYAHVLDYIEIDSDGGLEKVSGLVPADGIDWMRLATLFAHVIMIIFNVIMIITTGTTVMKGAAAFYKGEYQDIPDYMVHFMKATQNRALVTVSHTFIVYLLEVVCCLGLIILSGVHFAMFCVTDTSFDKFMFITEAFDYLQVLRTFSALKCFKLAHPEIVLRYYEFHMTTRVQGPGQAPRICHAVYFVATRLLAFGLSVAAFGVKLTFVSIQLHLHDFEDEEFETTLDAFCDRLWRWGAVISLLYQAAGAVSLERLMFWRLEMLIVGGRDCIVEPRDGVMREVYAARLAQAIWEEHYHKGTLFRYLVLMLTFDDYDLQFLLLNEDAEIKKARFAKMSESAWNNVEYTRERRERRKSDDFVTTMTM